MKVTCPNDLVTRLVKSVSEANQKGSSPADISQYTALEASEGKLSAIVTREDFAAIATVYASKVEGGLLKIEADGRHTVDGGELLHEFVTARPEDTVTIEYKKLAAQPKKTDDEADPEAATVETVGTVSVSRPAIKGLTEVSKMYSVGLVVKPSFEFTPDVKITVSAAEFAKHLKQVGISVGKATMSLDYSNLMVKVKGDDVEMVTTNGQQLTLATFKAIDAQKNVEFLLQYDQVVSVMKALDPTRSVYINIMKQPNAPQVVVFSQDVLFGGVAVGECMFRLREPACKFVSYEPLIKSLSFIASCKIKKTDLKFICGRLPDSVIKTSTVFDPEKELIAFSKTGSAREKNVYMPVTAVTGSRMELDISSGHVAAAVDACEGDEIELRMSGPKSLESMVLGPNLTTWFQPFRQA